MIVTVAALSLTFFVPLTSNADAAPAFNGSKVVQRVNLIDGADQVADSRTVHVTVSQTTNLRDRQGITVTWSGAHPTGGIIVDNTSFQAANEEYPVLVIQCRGVDSASAPVSQQVSPSTCFTETPVERFGLSQSGWPAFRMDRYDSPEQRGSAVNQPKTVPSDCNIVGITHWVPFVAADGTSYPGGPLGCAGIAPDQALASAALQASSTTYGVANAEGSGSTQFIAQTNLSNASLGCSATVKCTLEVIPIEGISCDPSGTGMLPGQAPPSVLLTSITRGCTDTGSFAPGDFNTNGQPDFSSTTGQYWWSESNWRNRIAVPLTFAPAADVCNGIAGLSTSYLYGSEAMAQATQQWAPAFCLNKDLFNLRHVQTSDPEAKSLLAAGAIQGAFQAGPPETPFATPTVQAPTALTGFGIAAVVDGADGQPYTQVKLDARLLAKLMTESYEGCALNCLAFDELASNPIDITRDPEFKALNPGVPETNYLVAAAALSLISADSDVVTALSAYINDDPEARSWLDGRPDPWGMVVNPAYRGISLPVTSWPLLDTHLANFGPNNACLAQSPDNPPPPPWLSLVAAPIANPALIPLNLQYNVANSQVQCQDQGLVTQKLSALGREQVGSRFLLGLVSLADAARYDLPTAALETHRSTDDTVVFASAAGRDFAAPTDAAVKAAAKLLKPDDALGTWPVPYDTLRTSVAGKAAYPGILLISSDIPTSGLSRQDAINFSKLLTFAAGRGQVAGIANGDIPPGYTPITAANGLNGMLAYTRAAAKAVLAQQCVVPYPSGRAAPAPSCNLPAKPPTTPPSAHVTTPNQPTPVVAEPTITPPASSTTSTGPAAPTASSTPSPVVVGLTNKVGTGIVSVALPVLALSALLYLALAGLAAPRRRR